jgi:hypothetical protein
VDWGWPSVATQAIGERESSPTFETLVEICRSDGCPDVRGGSVAAVAQRRMPVLPSDRWTSYVVLSMF